MLKTIEVEETIIAQKSNGISIGHMNTVIFIDKITSLRSVQLPSNIKHNDGSPALTVGTAIGLTGEQVLVAKPMEEVKKLLGCYDVNSLYKNINTDVQREKIDRLDENSDSKIIKFPEKSS